MHKYGTCKTKGNVSVGEVIDHVGVMSSHEASTAVVESVMEVL